MYRIGKLTSPDGMPPPARKIESVSVPLEPGVAPRCIGIDSRSAVAMRRATTSGCIAPPTATLGPAPILKCPCCACVMPGLSVAWPTSVTSATSGCRLVAIICAPWRPTSSCTVLTATTRTLRSFCSAQIRSVSAATQVPMRLSSARATISSSESIMLLSRNVPGSPMLSLARAVASSFAPMSMKSSCSLRTLGSPLRSWRWMAVAPIRPSTGASTPGTLERNCSRLPTMEPASMPPIDRQYTKPLESMWLTIRPISSACPQTATVNGLAPPAGAAVGASSAKQLP